MRLTPSSSISVTEVKVHTMTKKKRHFEKSQTRDKVMLNPTTERQENETSGKTLIEKTKTEVSAFDKTSTNKSSSGKAGPGKTSTEPHKKAGKTVWFFFNLLHYFVQYLNPFLRF